MRTVEKVLSYDWHGPGEYENCITHVAGGGRGVAERKLLEAPRLAAPLLRETVATARGPPFRAPAARRTPRGPREVTRGGAHAILFLSLFLIFGIIAFRASGNKL